MKFLDRIEQENNCKFIKLTEQEKKFYPGAGWYLVKIKNGLIYDTHSMNGTMLLDEIKSGDFTKQAKRLIEWASTNETYFGMFSCFDFCIPEEFNINKIAKIARLSFENHYENGF